ncbi:MAG TPA: hypothetical protein VHZ07_13995 [Bryobacteraceae bacterium]|jgi:hypothetical protein|nr:hypothetical protein [Bryobacteraceae bacterium]
MHNLYKSILRLYPVEYRAAFAPEILQTLEQAAAGRRMRGRFSFLTFAICELTGVVTGLFSEWTAKWTAREGYVTSRCSPRNVSDLPAEVVEIQDRLRRALASMEFAIAHHDFPRARFYSNEERVTRALLQRLMREYKLETSIDGCA